MDNTKRLIDEFLELVSIDSPTANEKEIATVLKAKLSVLGFEIFEDNSGEAVNGNCGNMFAFLQGTLADAPTIMLSAHMDSVTPCLGIEPKIQNGIITSNGKTILGADDKSGIVVILEAIRRLKEEEIKFGNIQIVFTVAEEGGLNGSKHINKDLLKADFGYVLDSSGKPGKIITAAPGVYRLKIIVHGKAAHAGNAPEKGINAIIVAAKALILIPQGRIDDETTSNVGIIQGGNAINIVPDKVEILCEVRSLNLRTLKKITQDIVTTVTRITEEHLTSAEIELQKDYNSYELDHNLSVIQIAKKSVELLGLSPSLEKSGGGSDANNFNDFGIPTVPLATGMTNVHTTSESISIEDLENTTKQVMHIIKLASQK